MELALRRATIADRSRMLEISAQVWDGEDYVPGVIDGWLAAEDTELLVALLDGELTGFARLVWLLPGYAWFEGLRTDPARQNCGVGKALMRELLACAGRAGAGRIGLSTYFDNYASIHIIESHCFAKVASFVYLEAGPNAPAQGEASFSAAVVDVPPAEALVFIWNSACLRVANGFLSHGWKFYPFARGPELALGQMQHVLGIRRDGRLTALLCSGRPLRGQGEFTIDFLDGEPGDVELLACHALWLARANRAVEVMVPRWGGEAVPALEVFKRLGFTAWNEFAEDVFVYERSAF